MKRHKLVNLIRLAFQYARFGIIGLLATLVHIGMFVTLIEALGVWELAANLIAFCSAVGVSFFGHSHWTFKGATSQKDKQHISKQKSFARFWLVATTGLIINTVIVYVIVEIWHAPYYCAIALMITVTPLFIFTVSKTWVFK